MKFSAILVVAAMAALVPVASQAQWIHDEQGSAFDDKKTHLAITGLGDYGFALRCTNPADLEMVLLAPEKMDQETAAQINALSPELMIRVDDLPPGKYQAEIVAKEASIAAIALVPIDLAIQIRDGNRRVSVALGTLGELFHEREYGLRGSTAAVDAMMKGCRIAE